MLMARDARSSRKEVRCVITAGSWWIPEWVYMPAAEAGEVLGQEQVSLVTVRKVEQSQQVAKR